MDVLILLALGADPNMLGPDPLASSLVTPMISATIHDNLPLLELLLLNGGDAFVTDANGSSALQHAVTSSRIQCASLLLKRGFSGKVAKATELRAKALGIHDLFYFVFSFIFAGTGH